MALEVDNVTAGYGPITVLRGVSLRVGTGEILGVLGRNGMGKSTLIRCISGLVPASAGAIRLEGQDIAACRREHVRAWASPPSSRAAASSPPLREREPGDGPDRRRGGRRSRLEEVLGYFPRLKERMGQQAGTMSGGEQQMLAIGRGLMTVRG